MVKVLDSTQSLSEGLEDASKKELSVTSEKERPVWVNSLDFLMSMIACAVGLGNVWRFPYLAFKYGGGTFLLVYSIFFFFTAIPMFLMEALLGQFYGLGATEIWRVFPILKGIGYATLIICFWTVSYYHVVISWALYYVFASFYDPLPWASCNNVWNDAACRTTNISRGIDSTHETAAHQYFFNHVLQVSDSFSDIGGIVWPLFGAMIVVWATTYLCIWRSLINARYFIWFSAIFPYFILFALLFHTIFLDGASEGIKTYLTPNFSEIWNVNLWKDAATQVFFSYGICLGGIIGLGAYNHFNNNIMRDLLLTCFINCGTSIIAGFVIFATLGHMSKQLGVPINEVAKGGPGLAFVVYPEALQLFKWPQFWAVIFFLMLTMLGFNSQVCMMEGLYTALEDQYPSVLRVHKKKALGIFCLIIIGFSLILITRAGSYWLILFESYGSSGYSLMFLGFMELVGVSWGIGVKRLKLGYYEMRSSKLHSAWDFGSFIMYLAIYQNVKEANGLKIEIPTYIDILSIFCCLTSILVIPGYAVYYMLSKNENETCKERLRKGIHCNDNVNKHRVDKFSLVTKEEREAYRNQLGFDDDDNSR